eukprot:TRINITY_DN5782_c0_g1_i5.p1 TRINITY_DN5782_c0_g1~~TRINITY_DN5782_c0_g1_i5.p1  ORF type:complete len:834 (+),score=271.91 TRINITY_DN5782_c0_g1_i5:57-2504(+)
MASPGEPTQLVQIHKLFKSQIRNEQRQRSHLDSGRRETEKRAYAQRLTFDDSTLMGGGEEGGSSAAKVPRLNPSFHDASSRRITSNENAKAITQLEDQNKALEEKLKTMTAENAGCLAKQSRLELRVKELETEMKRAKIESDHKLEKSTRLYKTEMERANDLKYKLKRLEDKRLDKDEREVESRRQSLDKLEAYENKVRSLREERNKLQMDKDKLTVQLRNRADIDPMSFTKKIQNYETSIGELRQKLLEYEEMNKKLVNRLEENKLSLASHKEDKESLARSKLTIEKLECELAANRDSFIQRKAMSEKLEQFSYLEKENQSLRNINELHSKTQENVGLLREQILNLTGERDRAEARARDRDSMQADLQSYRDELKAWLDLVSNLATPDERRLLASTGGVQTAREILKNLQNRELTLINDNQVIKSELAQANALIEKGKEILGNRDAELAQVKGEQGEQAKMIKKLQRKLLLVTKERDTSRAIMDSWEKELTVSGSSWEQSRIEALEKTLEEYKAMVNMLMDKDGNGNGGEEVPVNTPSSRPNEAQQKKIEELEKENAELSTKVEQLEMELEQRAIRGDYNPDETRVLHFAANPFATAVKQREVDVTALQAENTALKARIQLLEEGQTKDLTLMVGQKVEEGASSAEVKELHEKLKSADLKNQRIVELFKKTSREFRKVVEQTTGFRVDIMKNSDTPSFKMTPLFEDKSQYLVFTLSDEGGVELRENEFSSSLGPLIDKHLCQENSIPMFMASLIRHLFKRTQNEGDTSSEGSVEGEGEEEEMEGEGESEEGEGEGGEERSASNASSEVICVDDD